MADQFIALDEPSVVDKKLDTSELTVGANTVQRERLNIADPTSATGLAAVSAANGLQVDVTRVTGSVTVAQGTAANLKVDLSGTGANTTALKVDPSAVTSPVSAASLPLPAGASTAAKQPALGTAGTPSADVLTVQGVTSMTALKTDGSGVTQPVSGTVTANAGSGTMAVSAAALPLPSGAATAAKQPALGTAGSASADVISIQGVASMTAVKVDGSAVTQPVSISGNQAINVVQVAGSAISQGHGTAAAAIRVELPTDSTGVIGATQSGTWTVQPGNTANTTAWLTTQAPTTSGGLSVATGTIGATATSLKSSAGQVYGWYIFNANASTVYVQFFNTLVGSVTLGTTAPVYSLGIPAGSAANVEFSNGIAHSTAIVIGITTTRSGSTGPGSTVDYNVYYK